MYTIRNRISGDSTSLYKYSLKKINHGLVMAYCVCILKSQGCYKENSEDWTLFRNSKKESYWGSTDKYIQWFDLIWFFAFHHNLSVIKGRVFLGRTSTKLGIMCLAQGHNAVTPVRLDPVASPSRVKNSTTEPLLSLVYTMEQADCRKINR